MLIILTPASLNLIFDGLPILMKSSCSMNIKKTESIIYLLVLKHKKEWQIQWDF
jgi:hypothetical protein